MEKKNLKTIEEKKTKTLKKEAVLDVKKDTKVEKTEVAKEVSKRAPKKSVLTKKKPEKSLVKRLTNRAGRNSSGRITIRHRGGGSKTLYRIIDFKREIIDIPAEVVAVEYDPNRTAYIALIEYKKKDKERRYIIAPNGIKIGDQVITSSKKVRANIGVRMYLKDIPMGTLVHDVELVAGRGGQLIRSAGTGATILSRDAGFTHLKMPSGEIRMIHDDAMATVGQVSNTSHNRKVYKKAGTKRHMGIRPTVRGKAMNPVDHPHGGGEGRQPIGLKHPKTPWGAPALGYKTRNRKKASNNMIIKRRKRK
ncbi:50S ribosomal protein L2 [bacterium]|nr:50S ribosomal protein L2 [bacterium]